MLRDVILPGRRVLAQIADDDAAYGTVTGHIGGTSRAVAYYVRLDDGSEYLLAADRVRLAHVPPRLRLVVSEGVRL